MATENYRQVLLVLGRVIRKLRYGVLLIRIEGPIGFLGQMRSQIYSRTVYVGLERDLATETAPVPCQVEYRLTVASKEDMEDVLASAGSEGEEAVYELLGRKLFFDSGFRDCYLARAVETNEPCFVQWVISLANLEALGPSVARNAPRLRDDELWMENSYTFRKYRGKRVMSSVLVALAEIAEDRGFRRIVTYIREDGLASIKGCERAGFTAFERVPEVRFLFSTRRKYPEWSESIRSERG